MTSRPTGRTGTVRKLNRDVFKMVLFMTRRRVLSHVAIYPSTRDRAVLAGPRRDTEPSYAHTHIMANLFCQVADELTVQATGFPNASFRPAECLMRLANRCITWICLFPTTCIRCWNLSVAHDDRDG